MSLAEQSVLDYVARNGKAMASERLRIRLSRFD
jgi:hypothetical protein